MAFNFITGIINNPFVRNLFTQDFSQHRDFPPPGSDFRITDAEEIRVTDDGNKRITD